LNSEHRRQRVEAAGLGVTLLVALGFDLAFVWSSRAPYRGGFFFSLFDDAMISMTYARNFAAGAGLVWMPGEAPVEGYTNWLWTMWMAALHLLPLPESKISLAVMLSGVGILLANLLVVWALIRRLDLRSPVFSIYALAGVAFCYPLIFWTLRGMEVGLVCLVFNLCLLAALRFVETQRPKHLVALAVWTSLGSLVRPDFVVPAGSLVLVVVALVPRSRWLRIITTMALMVGLPLAAQWLFRIVYFEDVMPNTYYLKVVGHDLSARLQVGFAACWKAIVRGLWPLLLLAGVSLVRRSEIRKPLPLMLLVSFLSQSAYSIYVGGDAWEDAVLFANRYLSVVLPALILLSARGCERVCEGLEAGVDALLGRLGERGVRWLESPLRGALVAPVATALCFFLAWVPLNRRHFVRWYEVGPPNVAYDHAMSRMGLRIREATPPDTVIAVVWAGAVPYFAHRKAVDILGKNDPVIAKSEPKLEFFYPGHTKWDFSYSIGELRPDLIVHSWAFARGSDAYIRSLGYQPAPEDIGVYATPQLIERLGAEARSSTAGEKSNR